MVSVIRNDSDFFLFELAVFLADCALCLMYAPSNVDNTLYNLSFTQACVHVGMHQYTNVIAIHVHFHASYGIRRASQIPS